MIPVLTNSQEKHLPVLYELADFSFSYPFSHTKLTLTGKLSISRGERILISGPSGSGKSTLLMALKGLIPEYIHGKITGTVSYKGKQLPELSITERLAIGYLQQNPHAQCIAPDVYSELAFGLENLGLTQEVIAQKIASLAAKLQLTHLLTKPIMQLSGGERQQICLASLLLLEPQVLLLDEPTAFLDPHRAQRLLSAVFELDPQLTIIIIEHNWHYLYDHVTRVIAINQNGELEEKPSAYLSQMPTLAPKKRDVNLLKQNAQESLLIAPLLTISNLNYQQTNSCQPLLTNLNLNLWPGTIVAITGANGQGKSTLLKLMAGLPRLPGVHYQGMPLSQLKSKHYWRSVSLLWQNPEAHFLHDTVEAEVAGDEALLHQFNLTAVAKHNPFNLSEGQKRRLSLAIVWRQQPSLLLLDEPTFGQDAPNKAQIAKSLLELAAAGTCICLVSHDQEFMAATADTIYELSEGKLAPCSN